MTGRRDRLGPWLAPQLAPGTDLETEPAEQVHGRLEIGRDHRHVAPGRHARLRRVDQVDLGALALEPGVTLSEHLRRGHLGEPDRGPEGDLFRDRVGIHFYGDVMEHRRMVASRGRLGHLHNSAVLPVTGQEAVHEAALALELFELRPVNTRWKTADPGGW